MDTTCFAFQGEMLVVRISPKTSLPFSADISEIPFSDFSYRFESTTRPGNRWVSLAPGTTLPEGMVLITLRDVYGMLGEKTFIEAGRAFQLMKWSQTNRYCGRCGTSMQDLPDEAARACPACGNVSHPPVSPAIIVAIEKEGRILLARSPRFPKGRYSVIAGFVEPGETLEEAVERETMEEVSLKVKNICYFGSQPWPFPHSLMVAFTAEWDSGEIAVDGEEIEDAGWYTPDIFPELPPDISIARKLIDDFLTKKN
ncbi:MAG: NAD(+) diphosphatase [Thermovirgaceae bacterium]